MSVLTITTNETNTVETMSTLSFPNSSETEYTYITNPTEFEVSTEVSSISAEVSSISTLVFPSGDGYNSILNFESNETTSEDISNSTLIFPSENISTSEDGSNSTLMFESEDIFNSEFSNLMFKSNPTTIEEIFHSGGMELYGFCDGGLNWDNSWTDQDKDSFLHKWDNHLTDPYKDEDMNVLHNLGDNLDAIRTYEYFKCRKNFLRNYYIESTKNNRTDKPWWTSYENHFIGNAIIIIERKESKIDGVYFIHDLNTVSGLQLNKYDLLINNIFSDKNSIETLKERTKKAIKIRDKQIGDFIELIIQEILNNYREGGIKFGYYLSRKKDFFVFLALFLVNIVDYDREMDEVKINKMERWLDKVRHIYLTIILLIVINYIYIIEIGNRLNITTIFQKKNIIFED